MKRRHMVVPLLNNEYKVIVCWGSLQLVKRLTKEWGHEHIAEAKDLESRRGVTFYSKDCHPIIALPRFPKTAAEIGTLAHEATHAIVNVFEKIDERSYDEVFAHSIGAVVRVVLKEGRK